MEFASNFTDSSRLFLSEYLNSIKHCLETLNDEDIWWRPNEESNSIGNLLLHISGSLRQWILTGIAGAADHRVRQQEFDDRSHISKDELFSKLNSTVQDVDKVIAQIDTSRLMEKMQLFGKEVTWMFAIYHMIEHFSMHAGQIIMITKFKTGKNLALQ